MMITQASPTTLRELWTRCTPRIVSPQHFEDVVSVVVNELYEQFADSLVMVRAFLTVPFQSLPSRHREFARAMARSVQLEDVLAPTTPVHSLLSSRGCIEEWNDRRNSRGHVAIPLLSERFVESIPMMSRLLKELGLPLTWVQDPGAIMSRQTLGSEVGFFHVEDAITATDDRGRKVITAQEFVSEYAVKTVFAVGGVVFGGTVLVIIFFSRESVSVPIVRWFMPLINLLKAVMASHCSLSRVFGPEDGNEEENDPPTALASGQ